MRWMVLLFLLMPVQAMAAGAQGVDGVDWRSGFVRATGVGVPPASARHIAQQHAMACRAATVVAQRNLLEETQGVRIDSMTLVKDAMVESDIIRTQVKGIVKGARKVRQTLMEDGSCEVTMAMPISGPLFSTLISEKKFHQLTQDSKRVSEADFSAQVHRLVAKFHALGLIPEAHADTVPAITLENPAQLKLAKRLEKAFRQQGDQLGMMLIQQAITHYEGERDYTGIVIDATGVPAFNLAELPWIRDASGAKLYPNGDTPYDVVRSNLPVAYDFDMEDATRNKRVATKPVKLNAVSTYHSRDSDLVLDAEGSRRFIELMKHGVINKQARIMIVVNEE